MAELKITGNASQLKLIMRENRIRATRKGLSFSFTDDGKPDVPEKKKLDFVRFSKQEPEYEFSVRELLPLIEACETVEELKKYDGDDRKTVIAAYSKKLQALQA